MDRHPTFNLITLVILILSGTISLLTEGTTTTYATSTSNIAGYIPSAEVVHSSESMKVPPSVGTFVILIPNEAHENWSDEQHKLITDRNSYYIPTNLIIPNGTAMVFLHADAPWDTPNPHTIELQDSTGNVVYRYWPTRLYT